MPVAATLVFDALQRTEICTVERHEIASRAFGELRRSLRELVLNLRDLGGQEELELSDQLRAVLSEWLTVPVPFDGSMRSALGDLLGTPDTVRNRWGADVHASYHMALGACDALASVENPLREELRGVISDLRSRGLRFRIYCHRRARPDFESLVAVPADPPLSFLHSVRDYRESEPFDVLAKVGPLRARGWSSAPDALLTAPRFTTLVQVVWSGCADEPDFGYDPASSSERQTPVDTAGRAAGDVMRRGPAKWIAKVSRSIDSEDVFGGTEVPGDELAIFSRLNPPPDRRLAVLVQIGPEHGVLYPPRARVLSFDPAARTPVDHRVPGETLLEGMFVILPAVGDADPGEVRAESGHYSRIWRARLEQALRTDRDRFIERLRAAGLSLVHLDAACRHWCQPPTTVIHAPQRITHFEILLRVLGVEQEVETGSPARRLPFWRRAWNEIRRSRGEAIQAGFQEQEALEGRLVEILVGLTDRIRANASEAGSFSVAIPQGHGITGDFRFFKVSAIEDGFRAPDGELRVISELNEIDRWRD